MRLKREKYQQNRDASMATGIGQFFKQGLRRDKSLGWLILSILIAVVMQLGDAESALADEISYSAAIGVTPTNWSSELLLPQFDPTLGELSKIELNLHTSVQGIAAYENLGPNTVVVTMIHSATVELGLPNSVSVAYPQSFYTTTLSPFDGQFDQAGTSGGELKLTAFDTITQTLSSTEDITPFIGNEMITIPITATGSSESDGPGNFAILLRASASGSILKITYTFDAPNIEIETYTNDMDADDPNEPDVPQVDASETLTWTYQIRNTGNITFAFDEIAVTDSIRGVTPQFVPSSDDGDGMLTPGERWIYEYVTVATDLSDPSPELIVVDGCDPGQTSYPLPTYSNIGSVTVPKYDLTDSDPTHHCNRPQSNLMVRKLIDGVHVESNRATNVPSYQPGEPIVWTYEVTNLGAIAYPFDEISITDNDPTISPTLDSSTDIGGDRILSAGETWLYRATSIAQNLDQPLPGTTIVSGCGPAQEDSQRPAYENVAAVTVNGHVVVDTSYYCQSRNTTLDFQKLTNGIDADSADGPDVPQLAPGTRVVWQYQIENTGSEVIALSDIEVTDNHPGVHPLFVASSDEGDDKLLSPGEVWLFQAESIAQPLHIPNSAIAVVDGCPLAPDNTLREVYQNIGTVTVGTRSWSDPSHYCNPPQPQIDIEKWTNGRDADDPNAPGLPEILPGEAVLWTYIVHNTGNIHFAQADVQVVDSDSGVTPVLDPTSDLNGDGILSAGEIWRYEAAGTAVTLTSPPADAQTVPGCEPMNPNPTARAYMNQATVTTPLATDTDVSHYCNPGAPSITIEKTTNTMDADDPNASVIPVIVVGDPVTWNYVVRNTGNITYSAAEVTVTDSDPTVTPVWQSASDENNDGLLSPGEQWQYVATGVAQELQNAVLGTTVEGCNPDAAGLKQLAYQNRAIVRANDASDIDTSHYCLSTRRHLSLRKYINGNDVSDPDDANVPQLRPGDQIEWLYLVENEGTEPVHLRELVLTDSDPAAVPSFDPASDDNEDNVLSPGETWRYVARGIAQDLSASTGETTIVQGCTMGGTQTPQPTYQNAAVIKAGFAAASDISYYCNATPVLDFVVEKYTNGHDADDVNGFDVPVFIPTTEEIHSASSIIRWTYMITNTGTMEILYEDINLFESDPTLTPALDPTTDTNQDGILSVGESWTFVAEALPLFLGERAADSRVVPGCLGALGDITLAYRNVVTVSIGNLQKSDPSHYCNVSSTSLELIEEEDLWTTHIFVPLIK